MKRILLATLVLSAAGAAFPRDPVRTSAPVALCAACGIVQDVHAEKRKGKGGAAGIVGGALLGGLLGHQIGGGAGNTVATVGGAAAGGYVGNEVQKNVNSRTVWATTVRMKDGSTRVFEQETRPPWTRGMPVRAAGRSLRRL
jgi:outer membrane lipoprotein SlyB